MTSPAREAGNSFISEGLRLYCEAGTALRSLHQQVYKMCSGILVEHRQEIQLAFAFSCTEHTVTRGAYPDGLNSDRWEDGEVTLWVGFRTADGAHFSIGVYWELEDSGRWKTHAFATLEIGSVSAADRVWRLLSGPGAPDMSRESYEVHITKAVDPADEATLRGLLKEVLQKWLMVLRKVGGTKALQKAIGKSPQGRLV